MSDDLLPPTGPHEHHTLPLGSGRDDDEDVGTVIGPYRLLRRIGEGGMGEVFEAEQTEPLRRRVALKVIKQGMDTRAIVARFEAERQALALMDHPCIARALDAGATGRGRPYFVMEYVEGEPITDYCNRRRLGTRERLELFVRVCEGVQHAHQKAVIHRDLKPSNILVTEVDGRPVPKIIDFGVAKATTQRLTEMTMFTELGQMIGTPEYMSPEQAGLAEEDIDTRTDVYALGVVLYELLVGTLPFESSTLRRAGYDAIRRIIREQDPPKPSTRLGSLGEGLTRVAEARASAPRRLESEIRGDLDWITMKALEKDRERRYETANGLAADIRRHLRDEPVTAGPPGTSYRLRKLVRRNRGAFVALGAIATVLVVASVVSSILFVRAERASRAARQEATRANQVSRFLGDMLGGVGPQVAQGRDTEMLRAILDATAERIGKELADQPEVEATLRLQLADTYRQLGEYDAAQEQMDRIGVLRQTAELASPAPPAIDVIAGNLAWNRGDLGQAERHFRDALSALSPVATGDSLTLAEPALYLGNVLAEQGSYEEADSLMTRALALYRGQEEETDHLAVTLNSLGNLARRLGDLPRAESHYREALDIHRRVWGNDHPFVATDLHNLGILLDAMGRGEEGEATLREAIALQRRVFKGPHPDEGVALKSLSELLLGQARYDEADSAARQSYDIARSFHGENSADAVRALMALAEIPARTGRLAEAESIYASTVVRCRADDFDDPGLLITALYRLSSVQSKQGRSRDSLAPLTEAIERSVELSGADHPNTLLFRNDYARTLVALADYEAAREQLRVVLAAREKVLGEHHPETAITCVDLGRCLWRLGELEEAERLIRRGRDDYGAAKGQDHPGRWISTGHLGGILRDLGRLDDAERELTEAEDYFVKQAGPAHANTRWMRSALSTVCVKAGRREDADRWMALALDTSQGEIEPRSRGRIHSDRGEVLLGMGKAAEAKGELLKGFTILEKSVGAGNPDAQYAARLLAKACDKLGQPREATAWRARLQ